MGQRTIDRAREHGAVAVMVGLLATLLFSVGALAVDLGNAWARKRDVQKQVDVSALAAGWMLPMTTANRSAIADKVAEYLDDDANRASGQSRVTGAQLLDNGGVPDADGEIAFLHDDGTSCSTDCNQMRVVAPAAHVEFGLAGIMGFSGTDVQRSASVQVMSELPPKQRMIPFWLPTGCGYGPTQADTTGGTNKTSISTATATATATATTSATATASPTFVAPAAEFTLSGSSPTLVSYAGTTGISGYVISNMTGNAYKKYTLRAYPPNGTIPKEFAAQTEGPVSPFFIGPADVTGVVGDWKVYAVAEKNNGTLAYSNALTIRVTPDPSITPTATPTAPPSATTSADSSVGCQGSNRGNFGQLSTPRADESNLQKAFTLNIAKGLDHRLAPYTFPPSMHVEKECQADNNPIGAQLDDEGGRAGDGANCIEGDTGNDGPKTYDGLIAGVNGSTPGRLNVVNGSTTCTGRSNVSIGGTMVNNDVLSCFLRGGHSLADLASEAASEDMLDPAVVQSPRFVWMPVVYNTDRAQHGYQPILTFVPGFITDETQVSTVGHSDASARNGLDINGNSVEVMHVFTFNRESLPLDERSATTGYDPDLGGAIVRLVD